MLPTKKSYIMNTPQYVYYFYACIEGTYRAAILHILHCMMNISCHDIIGITKEVKVAVWHSKPTPNFKSRFHQKKTTTTKKNALLIPVVCTNHLRSFNLTLDWFFDCSNRALNEGLRGLRLGSTRYKPHNPSVACCSTPTPNPLRFHYLYS